MSFETYLDQRLLGPAGLDGIRYCPDEQDYRRAARGYIVEHGALITARPILMAYAFTAGAMCATAPGLVAWTEALAHGRVVDEAAWRAMITPVENGYGLGLFVGDLGGHPAIFHGGGINGFVSTLAYYPDDELHVAVLVNTESNAADRLGDAIAREVLGVPRPEIVDRPVDAAEGAAVSGRYQLTGVDAIFVVVHENGVLWAGREGDPERRRLLRQDDGSYIVEEQESRVRFVRDDGGQVTGFQYIQGGATFDAVRAP
jgi:CubicO group peptidase (beta-lactamase class C family)